jgi:hypothetical protein
MRQTRRQKEQLETAPWLKQPGESARAYDAFCRFRDLRADRSLTAVGRILKCSTQNVARCAARWRWKERCLAYDRHLDRIHCEELIAERRAMKRRQAHAALDLQEFSMKQLNEWQRRIKDGLPLDLSVTQIARLIEVGTRLERLGRGEDPAGEFRNIEVVVDGKVQRNLCDLGEEQELERDRA